MPTTDLHLVVDIAAWWTSAVYESGGVVQPVLFDGRARSPSGVFHRSGSYTAGTAALSQGIADPESYRPDPMTLLRHGGPVEVVAAVLGHVADRATGQAGGTGGAQVAALTVLTAQEWKAPARERLDEAAALAGLPRPRAVSTAAATAALVEADLVLVCVPGSTWPELTLVDCRDGYRQLAATPIRTPGAPAADEALLRVAAARSGAEVDPDDWRFIWEIERALAVLTVQPRAAMLLPEPWEAVVLTRQDVAAAMAVHLDRLPDVVKQVLADAAVEPAAVGAVVLVGEDEQFAAALAEAGLPPTVTVRDPYTLLRNAADARPAERVARRFWSRRRR